MTQEETKDYYDLTHPEKLIDKILCQTDGIPQLDHTNPDGSRVYVDRNGALHYVPAEETTLEEEVEKLHEMLAESPFSFRHKQRWYNNPNWWKIWNPESATPGGWIVIGLVALGLLFLAMYGEFGGF